MMNERMEKAINEQIKWELYSSYLYLSMCSWYESVGLKGFAQWERVQAQEELAHAIRFFDYVIARGGRAILQTVDAPPSSWESVADAFSFQLDHEITVTGKINKLVEIALEVHDHASYTMLQWYVSEQIEEEANAKEILDKIRTVEKEGGAGILYMLDKELGARIFTPPVPASWQPKPPAPAP
jgi:ferritin